MKVDIYKIHHSSWQYIIVPVGTNLDTLIVSLPGFYPANFKTYRKIQSGHDTLRSVSALNRNDFRQSIDQKGFVFSHRIYK